MKSERGQASVEWMALLALVAIVLAGLIAAGVRVPGTALAESIADRLVCAVRLGTGCGGPGELTVAYGSEVGTLVTDYAPLVAYERGMTSPPTDFREASDAAHDDPVTAFTRVVDCRDEAEREGECSGDAEGNLYLQYWFYYPDSYTAPWGDAARHDHDWESYQVRIGADGGVSARASAHRGYDYDGSSLGGWANQVGEVPLVGLDLPKSSGWGPELGTLWVSDDSHAGRVVPDHYDRSTSRRKIWLIPLEDIAIGEGATFDFGEVSPPWRKSVWTDPESKDT